MLALALFSVLGHAVIGVDQPEELEVDGADFQSLELEPISEETLLAIGLGVALELCVLLGEVEQVSAILGLSVDVAVVYVVDHAHDLLLHLGLVLEDPLCAGIWHERVEEFLHFELLELAVVVEDLVVGTTGAYSTDWSSLLLFLQSQIVDGS